MENPKMIMSQQIKSKYHCNDNNNNNINSRDLLVNITGFFCSSSKQSIEL